MHWPWQQRECLPPSRASPTQLGKSSALQSEPRAIQSCVFRLHGPIQQPQQRGAQRNRSRGCSKSSLISSSGSTWFSSHLSAPSRCSWSRNAWACEKISSQHRHCAWKQPWPSGIEERGESLHYTRIVQPKTHVNNRPSLTSHPSNQQNVRFRFFWVSWGNTQTLVFTKKRGKLSEQKSG